MNNSKQVLESVAINGQLNGLCLALEVVQTFVNVGKEAIEAIYNFPLPHGAALLGLEVKLNDKVLSGLVVPKKQAESDYEDAITDGNSAIMLECADDGLCTINVGNLMAGERAQICYRFSQLLNWEQDALRIAIPTTMAPRYGSAIEAGFQPHQITDHSLLVEYPLNFNLSVEQPLANAFIECPSHQVNITHENKIAHIKVSNKQAWLDRDFILKITAQNVEKNHGQYAKDGDQYIALMSIAPEIPGEPISSACIKVVVDCSGSMSGDSIAQARVGILKILDNLRETDTFNIVRFGDVARAYFPTCVLATEKVLNQARQAVEMLDADLGGTEMGRALDYAYALKDQGERPTSVLLITDGAVYQQEPIIKVAERSNHRIFTVGVGSAVAETFVREIAVRTGGAAALVSPNEGMAATIYRQFSHMFQPRALKASIEWPTVPNWQTPQSIDSVYAGDTLHVFGQFKHPPTGEAKLKLIMEDGRLVEQKVNLLPENKVQDLGRIANAQRIALMDSDFEDQATALAVESQLISRYTNYLIIEERSSEIETIELPKLVQVPHMLAAGYGGLTIVGQQQTSNRRRTVQVDSVLFSRTDQYDIPAFLRKQTDDFVEPKVKVRTPIGALVAVINEKDWFKAYQTHIATILPWNLQLSMDELDIEYDWDVQILASALLIVIIKKLENQIQRHDVRALLSTLKQVNPPNEIIEYFMEGINVGSKELEWESSIDLYPMAVSPVRIA